MQGELMAVDHQPILLTDGMVHLTVQSKMGQIDDRAAVFTEFRVFGARAAVWAKKLTVRNICTAIFADHKKISFVYLNVCPPKS